MVRSLKCEFKEVAHIVPVHRLDAEFLHKMLKDVICGLEKIGYRVVLQSTLPTISTDQHWECVRKQVQALHPSCNVVVSSETLSKIQDILPILVYVAEYAVYVTLKKLNCAKCKDALTVDKTITVSAAHEHYDLVKQLDRGGLVYPSMFALNAVAHNYVVVEQLATQPELLLMPEQRQVITKLTLHLLANEEPSDFDACENGHTSESAERHPSVQHERFTEELLWKSKRQGSRRC
ncbi:uncharacterized protein LOC121046653 [Ixodes scapularis]|uniref:uncharacterized protein LOC121046653 n=1 Tax=Ixodes scapularis TaxID=6945 RepID=UPI001C383099|nr:uncharacterized protein LOC121046653 [Ixodes scapularis]